MSNQIEKTVVLELTTEIVASYVGHNSVASVDLPGIIQAVHKTLTGLGIQAAQADRPKPAVSVQKSITPDYVICLEDGKPLKMLKRHLKTAFNMTPDEYRERWDLPADYPMVAPNYAKHRSSLAKKIGLGTKPKGK